MNCDEADELLGARALDALPAAEARAFDAHAAACPRHAAAAEELRAAAMRLAAAPTLAVPPASLRARVLAAVATTPQDQAAATTDYVPTQGAPRRADGRSGSKLLRLPRRVPLAWAGVAAVLVAVIIGLTAWNVVLQRRSGSDVAALASRATSVTPLQATGSAPGGGVVVYYAGDHKALIITEGLPALDPGQHVYQLWAMSDGKPTSLGLVPPPVAGSSIVVVPFDAETQQQVAVSVEPPGGSTAPTSAPVLIGKV